MAVEEGWRRPYPHVQLDRAVIERLLGVGVERAVLLSGGLRNTNYRVELANALSKSASPCVLRLYTADAAACAREVALMRLVGDRVPVPRVLQADPSANPPWAVFEWLDGERFDRMLLNASPSEVEQACRSAGEVLAAIHAFSFPAAGSLGPDLSIARSLGGWWLAWIAEMFASDRARDLLGADLARGIVHAVEQHAWRIDFAWGQSQLVHADYKPWNLLVRRTVAGWHLSAALDWEFAFAGPPLTDFGIYLRYSERMPPEYVTGFVDGYRAAGGDAPQDLRELARLIDLVSLWTFLERAEDDPVLLRDVTGLLEATVAAFR